MGKRLLSTDKERSGDFMNKRDEDRLTNFLAVVIVFGVILLFGAILQASEEKECAKYGCDRTVSGSEGYCYVHDIYRSFSYKSSGSSYSSSSSSSSSSSKNASGSSTLSSTKKSSSGSSSKKSSSSSWSSYDEGYDAVYEDDDYDWDRYWSDSDYADGVDDAMEDMDW